MLNLTISKLRSIAKGRNMFKKQLEDLFNLFTKPQDLKYPKSLHPYKDLSPHKELKSLNIYQEYQQYN